MADSAPLSEHPSIDWGDFRRQMPVTQRWAYLDHAAVAPITQPAQIAMQNWASDAVLEGDTAYTPWMDKVERARAVAAEMIGADADEIALVRNTTEGINFVSEGFPWQRGDNVVLRDDEFPSNQYPWLQLADRGVQTRRVPVSNGQLDLDRLADACDDRTRIVSVSWVTFSHGWRHDVDQLAEIAHRRGALLFLDAIQGLGVLPLDVKRTPVDFLAADGHKWLLGPEGAGVFFLRKEHLSRLRPMGIGWNSVAHCHDFGRIELTLKDTAARYEGGSPNTAGLLGLGASLQLLADLGADAISRRLIELTDLACERLEAVGAIVRSDRHGPNKSGIVAFEFPGRDPQALRERCLSRGVVLSCRGGRLRISPHAYNDASDIDRLIEALAAC